MEKLKLEEIIIILPKSKIKAGDGKKEGKYPLYRSSNKLDTYYDEYLLDEEVIIIGTGGNPSIHYNKGKCAYTTQCLVIKSKGEFENKYIYYYLLSRLNKIKRMFRGLAIKQLDKKAFFKLDILLVDKVKQKIIIDNLDKISNNIQSKKEQLKSLEEFIKSQFVEMFGEPLISNNYGRITLDKLIKVSQGLQIPIGKRKNDKGRNRYKYITIQYLNGSKKEEYIENPNERVICNKEDILMTRTGNTGQVITNVEGVFHNNFFKMDYDRKIINKEFLIKYFENELIYKDIIRRATTSTIPDLSHNQFYKMSIDLPPLELQNQFSEIVKQIDKQKFEIEKSLKETQELYESLMKEYFKGAMR